MSANRVLLRGLLAGVVTAGMMVGQGWSAEDRVVAIVNDQVITNSDLQANCKLAVATAGASLSPQQQQAVCRRTLTQLIDAELQRQYAATRNLEPSEDDFKKARAGSEKNFADVPKSLMSVADDQLRSELRWQGILKAAVRPRVNVGVAEVDQLINTMSQKKHVEERQLAQILMNVPSAADEDAVRARMEDVQKKLAAGEDFAQLARAYSDGTEAKSGGDMGWFGNGELNPDLEQKLNQMKPGEVSGLIRTPLGWHLIKVLAVRESQTISTQPIEQVRVLIVGKAANTTDKAAEAVQESALEKARSSLKNEDNVRAIMYDKAWPESSDLGWIAVDDLQPDLRKVVMPLKDGQVSAASHVGGNDVLVYRAAERKVMPPALNAYRDRVYQHLFQQRMEQEAHRFMRELRQRAFVDIRS